MYEFFTVSRNDISNLTSLDLYDSEKDIATIYELTDFFTQKEAVEKIKELFPNGISNHGKQYLHDKYNYVNDADNNSYISYLHIIEITFELIRQISFKDKPSRFESLFGCETIEEAIKFRTEKGNQSNKIYKVSTDSFFKADMNLLYTATIPGNILIAEKYWRGESSKNPFWEILMKAPINILEEIT